MSGDIFKKYNINISIIIHFKQYLPSSIQSAVFTGRAARQKNCLYVLYMVVKLAYLVRSVLLEFGVTSLLDFGVP